LFLFVIWQDLNHLYHHRLHRLHRLRCQLLLDRHRHRQRKLLMYQTEMKLYQRRLHQRCC
jgi:hypothetical protein